MYIELVKSFVPVEQALGKGTFTSCQKKKLKVEEANVLVRRLLQSILVNDELDETIASEMEAESGTDNEHESEDDTDTENDPNKKLIKKKIKRWYIRLSYFFIVDSLALALHSLGLFTYKIILHI